MTATSFRPYANNVGFVSNLYPTEWEIVMCVGFQNKAVMFSIIVCLMAWDLATLEKASS